MCFVCAMMVQRVSGEERRESKRGKQGEVRKAVELKCQSKAGWQVKHI